MFAGNGCRTTAKPDPPNSDLLHRVMSRCSVVDEEATMLPRIARRATRNSVRKHFQPWMAPNNRSHQAHQMMKWNPFTAQPESLRTARRHVRSANC